VAHPARFELTTSAFGGQFPEFAAACYECLYVEQLLVLQ
jgi:hypothetical protein